MSVTSCTWTNT